MASTAAAVNRSGAIHPRRIAVIASASGNGNGNGNGNGKTMLEPELASDGWVIDGSYERKLGTSVLRYNVRRLRTVAAIERFREEMNVVG